MKSESESLRVLGTITVFIGALIAIAATALILTSCTISFQNIATHGTASDVVDEDQNVSPDIKTDLSIPLKAI